MNILVTGGTGYIGEHFIPQLIENGHSVTLLVRNLEKGKKLFKDTCKYIVGDITDKGSLKGCCENIDVVFHMVAMVGNQLPSDEEFKAFRAVNVGCTRNIVEEAKMFKVSRFVFVSSIAAMGIVKETPINEKSPCNPYLPYQVTKYEAEQYINEQVKDGFPAVIVRPTKVYGVGEHEYSYLTLAKLCKKGFFPKVGKGKNYTSNIYITDFVQALVNLVDNGSIGETYILSSADSIGLTDAGRIISEVLGKKIRIISIPAGLMVFAATVVEKIFIKLGKKPIVTRKNIEATVTDRVYDIHKAREEIGFDPRISHNEGIRRVVKWYKKEGLV